MIGKLTQEMIEQAQAAREAKKQWAIENLQMDYAEENYWRELSKEADIRLPQRHIANTESKYLKRALKKLNIDNQEYLESCGVKNFKELASCNPQGTALMEVGLILEHWKESAGCINES